MTPYEQAYAQAMGVPRRHIRRSPSRSFTAVLDALAYLNYGTVYRVARQAAMPQSRTEEVLVLMERNGLVERYVDIWRARVRTQYLLTEAGQRLAATRGGRAA